MSSMIVTLRARRRLRLLLRVADEEAIFLDSGTGFWEFNCAGFYFALMLWLMVYSSACSSVLQVISGDIDGIIHRHSCCAEFGCWFLSFYVSCGITCLSFSQRAVYNYNRYYSIHIFTETKKAA